MDHFSQVRDKFKGAFLATPEALQEKLSGIKAFVFDWDGVFNDGRKDEQGSSSFSEVDSMGVNMLRFNHFLHTGKTPFTAIISGEKNRASFTYSAREHVHAGYYKILAKLDALRHVCDTYHLEPLEIAYFFDDVLDLAMAEQCGLRIMIGRPANPCLTEFAGRKGMADYITALDGGRHAVREASELLIGIRGLYDETIEQRSYFTESYKEYLRLRNMTEPVFYTNVNEQIKEQQP